jgi:hypothetical protein
MRRWFLVQHAREALDLPSPRLNSPRVFDQGIYTVAMFATPILIVSHFCRSHFVKALFNVVSQGGLIVIFI